MADVSRLAGLIVSEAAALELIGVIDELVNRAAPGEQLSTRVATIRHELITCVSGRSTRARASIDCVAAPGISQSELSIVDTTTAAQLLGIKRDGVTWLRRQGKLRGDKNGGRWWIELASLQTYREQRRGRTQEA